jgi:16S rRNA U516 pseudouridylate synthase RsuA-like enzyme
MVIKKNPYQRGMSVGRLELSTNGLIVLCPE